MPVFLIFKITTNNVAGGSCLVETVGGIWQHGVSECELYGIICFTSLIFRINQEGNAIFFLEIFVENLWIIKRWVDIVFWHVWIIGKGFCPNKTVWLCPMFKCEFAKAGYIIGACRTLLCWLMILFFCAHIFRSEIINLSIIIDKFEKYFRM